MNDPEVNRPLEPVEVQQFVASTILAIVERGHSINALGLVNPEHCAIETGMSNGARRIFVQTNKDTFPRIANTFVNRLIDTQIIERDWTQGDAYEVYRLNPDRAVSLELRTTPEGIATVEFVESLEDGDLRLRCEAAALRAAPPESMLREAVNTLEDRLGKFLGPEPVDRRDLAARVLDPQGGKLTGLLDDPSREKDLFHLVGGLLGFYGTPVHQRLEELPAKMVRRVVGVIDEILMLLEPPAASQSADP